MIQGKSKKAKGGKRVGVFEDPSSLGNLASIMQISEYFKTPKFLASDNTYSIVDTDYDNYSVLHTCNKYFGFLKLEFVIVLTRKAFDNVFDNYEAVEKMIKDSLRYKFKTEKRENYKYDDFKEWILPVKQGEENCDYSLYNQEEPVKSAKTEDL